jgi:hypothetical protein
MLANETVNCHKENALDAGFIIDSKEIYREAAKYSRMSGKSGKGFTMTMVAKTDLTHQSKPTNGFRQGYRDFSVGS